MSSVSSTSSSTSDLLSSTYSTSSTTSSSTSSTSSSSSSSSIDWDSLIEEAVQAKLDKADTIDTKITANEAKISAYENLQSLLGDIQSAAQSLRAPSGTSNASDDAFLDRAAYLTAVGDVDTSSSVSVTVDSGSDIGTHDLQIVQLATTHKISGSAETSSTTDLGYSGVMSVGVVDGTAVDITIDSGMTLAEIAEAINNETDTTGVQATVLKVSSSSYKLVLSSSDTGKTIAASAVSGDDVLQSLGITDSSGDFANVLQASQSAIIKLDGIEITRESNDIDDVLDGATFHLYQTTPDDTSITVDIGVDVSAAKTAVQSLVDAYNAFRDYVVTQQTVTSSGTASSDAVLFGDGTLRTISSQVYDALNTTVNKESMALLGLTFDENNNLELDEDTLDNALLDDLDAVQQVLSFQMTSSSQDLLLLSRGTSSPADFTLDITTDSSGAITSASVDGNSSLFTVSGTRIIGAEGSAYEGFTFVYTGSASKSVDLSFSSGLAELLYNATTDAVDSSDGSLQTLIDNLESVDDTLQTKSDDIRSRAETYRTNLTNRYAKYQSAISQAESMQDYLTQLLATWNASS
ncbi:flagellar hook protein [Phreatobacter aquaticus]|uniref:Flagellar hook-associated protein 2 n=1 Tax=Phreatobacter aquaticus TaxID=2570229 RepID=A0A4D7QC56_9HYPH|nr:flagellar filament capping protein FliD [Phreatobacter aquaticus]QCK85580.1 flagellar hook protein [Phreatobacter aquaticus]